MTILKYLVCTCFVFSVQAEDRLSFSIIIPGAVAERNDHLICAAFKLADIVPEVEDNPIYVTRIDMIKVRSQN